MFGVRRSWIVGSMLAALVVGALVAVLVLRPWAPGPEPQRFPRAAVAANGYECASIGRAILEKNGSAVDAAIATLFCEGAACAQCMGLGGGFLATVYDAATGRVRVLNSRERAPAATTRDMYANSSSTVGGLAIAVPGELRGYGELYRAYGRLPWRDLVQPTASMVRAGHRVNAYMARVLNTYSDIIKAEPSMRELYVNEATGEVWREGDLLVEAELARTLDVVAAEGPEAMHNGSLTARLVADIRRHGGIITEDDMRYYKTEWQEPIVVPITTDYSLYSVPLPGSGSILAFILNMLRGSSVSEAALSSRAPSGRPSATPARGSWPGGPATPASGLYWHRVVETFKYAYAKRTGLGDPSRHDVTLDIRELERNLSTLAFAESHRALVDDLRTYNDWQHYGAMFEATEDHGTAHVVVVAPDGSAVSATSTINYIWGSQRRSTSLGIMLNNEMDDFAIPDRQSSYGLPPSPANMLAPGLQPLSSMTPSIILDNNNQVKLVVGAAGGTKITTQVALITRATILESYDLPSSMNRPRLHHQLLPMEVQHEADFDIGVIEALRRKGHATTELGPTAGFAAITAAIRDDDGYLVPQTDRRRVGSIDGF